MIINSKCECGHQNHIGTVLCESCGKPLEDDRSNEPLEMRYDGVARRSQKEKPGLLDKVWNFFSSVKVAIYLIMLTLLAAALGTIYPQENVFLNIDPSVYYKENYGTLGHIYYLLGLSRTFESWWFITLLLMIGTSLIICSLDRVLPLYRALSKQQIRKHMNFLQRQKVTYQGTLPGLAAKERDMDGDEAAGLSAAAMDQETLPEAAAKERTADGNPSDSSVAAAEKWMDRAAEALKKRHYRVHRDGTALLAEKHRFSRWGPYINHIGLIIFLGAVLMRAIPGWHMDQHLAFREGIPVKIPDTDYYLLNEQFTVELYEEEEMSETFRERGQVVPKRFETKAVLYRCTADCDRPDKQPVLEEVHRQNIIVNKPLEYEGLLAYQFDFEQAPQLLSVKPRLVDKQTGEVYGSFDLPMSRPAEDYEVGPYKLQLKAYFPEFGGIGSNGLPITLSNEPNAPAFVFSITGPGLKAEGEPYMYFPRQIDKEQFRQDQLNGELAQKLELSVGSMEDVAVSEFISYLNIRVDRALPFIWVGSAIFMIGVIIGFYWHHRRIWLRIDDEVVTLGAHTNKNWFGLRKEVSGMLTASGIPVEPKQLEREEGKK